MRKNKNRQKYIDEVLAETWKTIHTEHPTEVIWDEDMECFLCENETDIYYMDFDSFFKKHVIGKNQGKWGVGKKTKKEMKKKSIASWLCLINGHNLFEDYRARTKKKPECNEGNNLLVYIQDRYEDALFSMDNKTVPEWLEEYLFEDGGQTKLKRSLV